MLAFTISALCAAISSRFDLLAKILQCTENTFGPDESRIGETDRSVTGMLGSIDFTVSYSPSGRILPTIIIPSECCASDPRPKSTAYDASHPRFFRAAQRACHVCLHAWLRAVSCFGSEWRCLLRLLLLVGRRPCGALAPQCRSRCEAEKFRPACARHRSLSKR